MRVVRNLEAEEEPAFYREPDGVQAADVRMLLREGLHHFYI